MLTSRGYGYPTANEAALKLMETSYIPALSYSGADLVVVGSRAEVDRAVAGFALPTGGVPEELQPVLEILPLQRLAYEVTLARGQAPDAPRSLAKVTETR